MVLIPPRRPRPRTGDDEGLVAVVTAFALVLVVMPLLALVVDLGLSRTAGGQARVAADAAALAAAAAQRNGADVPGMVQAAHRLANDDFGLKEQDWASCVDPNPLPAGTLPAPGNCVSFDLAAKQVRVTLPSRPVPSVFAGVLGSSPPAASATSTASWGAFSRPCVLCVLGSYVGGAQQLEVRGGDVAVGGDLSLGTGLLTTDPGRTISVGGTVSGTDPRIRPGGVPADPFATQLAALAALPAASASAVSAAAPAGTACTPGTYQDVSDCQSFAPGVYVLTGQPQPAPLRWTITLKGSGTGVVFYVTCSTPVGTSPVRPRPCSAGSSEQPRINVPTVGSATLGGHPGFAGLVLAFDPSPPPAGANTNQRFTGAGTLTLNGSIDGPTVVLRNPATATLGRVVVSGGRVVVKQVAYDDVVPVVAHPYLTVQAPAAEPLPDGPVRLVPAS